MIRTADQVFPEVIFAVHLDHGTEDACYDCIESGFYSSVMIDASHEKLPKNIEITRRVVDRPTPRGSLSKPNWANSAASRRTLSAASV